MELHLSKMLHHQHSDRDLISLLPEKGLDHVAENILYYLDEKSLCAAELVCKEWYQVISEGMLWKKLIERRVRTDSLWRRIGERRGWIKYLFKPSLGEPHLDHMFYRRLYPKIIQDIGNIETNWRCGRYTLKRINCQKENGANCFQFDDYKIVSGLRDNTIKIWDRNTLECIQILKGHDGPVECLQYDDRVIISGSRDSTVRVWDVKTGELINTKKIPRDKDLFHLRFNNGMSVSYCDLPNSRLRVWNMVSHSKITTETIFCDDSLFGFNINDYDGKYVVSANMSEGIEVFNPSTGELVRTLGGHNELVLCLQHRDRLVVSGCSDGTIKIWDVESGACLRTLGGHKSSVACVQFDNKRIVSGALDGQIKVWDLVAALDPQTPTETLCLRTLQQFRGFFTLKFDDFQIVTSNNFYNTILIFDFLNDTPPETPAMNIRKRKCQEPM